MQELLQKLPPKVQELISARSLRWCSQVSWDFSPPPEHSLTGSWCSPAYELLLGLEQHELLAQALTSSFSENSISDLQ